MDVVASGAVSLPHGIESDRRSKPKLPLISRVPAADFHQVGVLDLREECVGEEEDVFGFGGGIDEV